MKMKEIHLKKKNLIKFFILIVVSVFIVEFSLMFFLEIILDTTHLGESLADASLLSIVISPVLYIFSFRFLNKEISNNEGTEKKYKYIYENSSDAIMMLNPPYWKFTEGNSSMIKMFGLNNNDLKAITPSDLSPEYQPDGRLSSEKSKEMIDIAVKDGKNSFSWTHKKLNGSEFLASVLLVKVEMDDDIFLQAVVKDITIENKLLELNKKKEEELQKALLDTERMNKLMVGREIEMIKLKKEIIRLKGEGL